MRRAKPIYKAEEQRRAKERLGVRQQRQRKTVTRKNLDLPVSPERYYNYVGNSEK